MKLTNIKDLDFQLMLSFDDRTLYNFCLAGKNNPYVSSLCSNDNFWRNRFYQNFPNQERYILARSQPGTWKNNYIHTSRMINKLKEDFNFVSDDMRDSADNYYKFFSVYKERRESLTDLVRFAIAKGYIDIIKYAIERGFSDFDRGLILSVNYGDMEAFLYFKKLIEANGEQIDYEDLLPFTEFLRHKNLEKHEKMLE